MSTTSAFSPPSGLSRSNPVSRTESLDEDHLADRELLQTIPLNSVKSLILCNLCAKGNDAEVKKILEAFEIDVNIGDYDKRTPLHLASEEGHFECVKLLLDNGAEPLVTDRWGETPYQLAVNHNHSQIALYLKEHGGTKISEVSNKEAISRKAFDKVDPELNAKQMISKANFKKFLLKHGINLKRNERARELFKNLCEKQVKEITWESFKAKVIEPNTFFKKVIEERLVIRDWPEFCRKITKIYEEILATATDEEERTIAISICSVDGQCFSLGDAKRTYPIESCVKPLTYSLVVEDVGYEVVHQWIGMEPSGKMYNDFTLNSQNKPHNACINSGAIALCGLYKPTLGSSERFKHIYQRIAELAGNPPDLGFDQEGYLSTVGSSHANYALGYYMASLGVFPPHVKIEDAIDFYFQICSISVSTEILAAIASCYANYGVCPLTQKKIFTFETVKRTMQLMFSCGMYDFSGEWSCTVGIPAKSGGSGSILLAIPDVCGISIYSPKLDLHGNSLFGVKIATKIAEEFGWNIFDLMFHGPTNLK